MRLRRKPSALQLVPPTPLAGLLLVLLLEATLVGADDQAGQAADGEFGLENVTTLATYNVKADRIEDFGFRISGFLMSPIGSASPYVTEVMPNTAASKAGLRPGDRIVRSDGSSASVTIFSLNKWRTLQARKWAEVASGKKNVTWTLEVESAGTKEIRLVKMVVPTPSPHWGSAVWQPPEGRIPAHVPEPGPLAERAGTVLDHGLESAFNRVIARGIGLMKSADDPFLGFHWALTDRGQMHRFFVTQSRGRTEIILELWGGESGWQGFATSPSGALEKAWSRPRKGRLHELTLEEARSPFTHEMDFWLLRVSQVSPRWPLELIPGSAVEGDTVAPMKDPASSRSKSFLELPAASPEERALFATALGKIGADEDRWSYTETSRGLDDKSLTVVRVDPSKPETERTTLLTINGRAPTAGEVVRWRDEGRDSTATLGELPPLASVVDLNDVRVAAREMAATVFELPLRTDNPNFPAEKFQALFRVNTATQGFEDISVRLRESFRVKGVVKVTEAGLEIQFRSFDPALAPQPVLLKAGGAVRVLLVRFARSFEATRTSFQRVERP